MADMVKSNSDDLIVLVSDIITHVTAFFTGGTGPGNLTGIAGTPVQPQPDAFPVVSLEFPAQRICFA